jgi:hypothetical protein
MEMTAFLGFSAEILGVEYPAVAIFKLSRGAGFCWNGDHPTEGFLAIFDLVRQKRHFVCGSWEVHGSRHRDGGRHQTLQPTGHESIHIAPYRDTAAKDLVSDSHIRTVTVPLLQPFDWWPAQTPLWNSVNSRIVLRREDFGDNVDGVFLHGYICRHEYISDLIGRWQRTTARTWVERDGDFDLVVLAEVVRVPMPTPH